MNFELFFFTFSCILISYNLSAMVKKLTCFMFSYCINYSRHLTLKQQKNLHRELFIQMKGRSKDKPLSFQPFSECYMFLYFCGKNYFLFSIRSIMRNYISFCEKKNFYCNTLNQFRPFLLFFVSPFYMAVSIASF